MVIHLNPLHELINPNEDRDLNFVLEAIENCASRLGVPIIVKEEVGAAIGPSSAKQSKAASVEWREVVGHDGTSSASIKLAPTAQ